MLYPQHPMGVLVGSSHPHGPHPSLYVRTYVSLDSSSQVQRLVRACEFKEGAVCVMYTYISVHVHIWEWPVE